MSADEKALRQTVRVDGPDAAGVWRCAFFAFDTVVLLRVWAKDAGEAQFRAAFDHAVAYCRRAEALVSRFVPTSDVSRLNAASGARVVVDRLTHDLLEQSLRYCAMSEGAFDVTMGGVCALWDFHRGVVPGRQALDEALSHVDWRKVHVGEEVPPDAPSGPAEEAAADGKRPRAEGAAPNPEGTAHPHARFWARLDDPKAMVDLGGVAKGFFADDLRDGLVHDGMDGGIVNLGGNAVVFGGRPDGSPWGVGVRDPSGPHRKAGQEGVIARIPLHDGSVVTSGPYERCFTKDGRVYHHILSTSDGMPVDTDLVSATVVSARSADGDGLSTTLFALGAKKATALVEATDGVEALLVRDDGRIVLTSGLRQE